MKCELSAQAYKWHDGTQWHVGKLVIYCGHVISRKYGAIPADSWQKPMWSSTIQVAHSHTRELEFVDTALLSPYGPPGGDKMPEPKQ